MVEYMYMYIVYHMTDFFPGSHIVESEIYINTVYVSKHSIHI